GLEPGDRCAKAGCGGLPFLRPAFGQLPPQRGDPVSQIALLTGNTEARTKRFVRLFGRGKLDRASGCLVESSDLGPDLPVEAAALADPEHLQDQPLSGMARAQRRARRVLPRRDIRLEPPCDGISSRALIEKQRRRK